MANKIKQVYIVFIGSNVITVFSSRKACHDYLLHVLPAITSMQIKSYPQFCRDVNKDKIIRIFIADDVFYTIKKYRVISRLEQLNLF